MTTSHWPVAGLDPVRRLRVMAAGLGAAMYAERRIDAPFAQVWATAADLDRELPHLVPTVREFRVEPGPDERRAAWALGPLGHRARFEVVLRPGWCLMQSAMVIGGMAAVPEDDGTRFAVLGTVRQPVWAPLRYAVAHTAGPARAARMIDRVAARTAARAG
jgi:hypothetical protein